MHSVRALTRSPACAERLDLFFGGKKGRTLIACKENHLLYAHNTLKTPEVGSRNTPFQIVSTCLGAPPDEEKMTAI